MKEIIWKWSNSSTHWGTKQPGCTTGRCDAELSVTSQTYQKMYGFGACFNELGWQALSYLSESSKKALFSELFAPDGNGAKLNICRLPIGANDYSFNWYSLDETPNDYDLSHFSIKQDQQALIPYIQSALTQNPDLKLMASPWSPPTWMKYPPVYNWGKLIWQPEILTSYADYLIQFLKCYAQNHIFVTQLHVQNEPVANQKFPSCMWTGEELRDFIRDYLGPALRSSCPEVELWLGTINAPGCDFNRLIFDKWATEDYDFFAHTVLSDPKALSYISGVSYQWGGKIAIQRTFESWYPQIRLMQSENECGFGDNTWEYARYVWTMLKHYIGNGAESYLYWNLVLKPGGVSTWGDPQNAMITIEPSTKKVIFNPDYYVMKHFSAYIQRGAIRLGINGNFSGNALVFENPDKSLILELYNPFSKIFSVKFQHGTESYVFDLEPQSINSILLPY
ncbi:glycosyl hydrolase [Lachnospiraceae bacterium oral taxon 500]|nr:glycosyl hydrolase [Lachnospiraceae bacterium oral taxon 500]